NYHGACIAVVVPCYKVEQSIAQVVAGIPASIDRIILVDDKSPGTTPNVLDTLAAQSEGRVIALHHEENRGVGGATMTGMKHAVALGADIIVKMDGDGQMDPEYLPDLLEPLLHGEADFTKGCRFTSADVLSNMPLVRLIGNAGLSFLNRLASGYWNTLDPTNGYFAIRSEMLEQLSASRIHHRYFFESSLLIELGINRAVVRDIPMRTIYGDEESHLSPVKTLLEFPPKLFAGFCRRIWMTKVLLTTSPDVILGLCGTLMVLLGTIFGAYKWLLGLLSGHEATSGTVMFAALPIILGLQMGLFALLIDIQSVPTVPISRVLDKRRSALLTEIKRKSA
ncbi:MAG: glycosyltransferase family 2 protein, partial [Thermoguttaceae bacterium]